MKQGQFLGLIRRLEDLAARQPRRYRVRLGAVAALGPAYIGLVLLVLLAVLGLLTLVATRGSAFVAIASKFGAPLLGLVWVIGRALRVRLRPPTGVTATRDRFPALFLALDRLRARTGSPRFKQVLLTEEFNAAIVQHPRFGLLGWYQNYLLLGLPLLQALDPVEMRAVLGHEMGHVRAGHGRFGSFIYRSRLTWSHLLLALEQRRGGDFLFKPFLRWYAPYFNAYSFIQARRQEYEADRVAAEATSGAAAASALVRLRLWRVLVHDRFWQRLWQRADSEPELPGHAFADLSEALRAPLEPAAAQEALARALAEPTGYADTHPSLADRLRALGQEAALPPAVGETAAQELLGAEAEAIVADLEERLHTMAGADWRVRHQEAAAERERLRSLAASRSSAPLDDEAEMEHAQLVERQGQITEALSLYAALAQRNPGYGPARFAIGRLLLDRGDDSGIGHLEQAMALDPEVRQPARQLIIEFLDLNHRAAEAAPLVDEHLAEEERAEESRKVRSQLKKRDELIAHDLPASAVERLRAHLAVRDDVRRVYLVRKRVPEGEASLFVVAVLRRRKWWVPERQSRDQRLANELADGLEIDGEALVVVLGEKTQCRRYQKVEGSLLFARDGRTT